MDAIISEVNEEDPEYGMPRIEDASINSMVQVNLGVNKKMANIFGTSGTADYGGSGRPTSTHSGVFGGAVGSFAMSPNASMVRD